MEQMLASVREGKYVDLRPAYSNQFVSFESDTEHSFWEAKFKDKLLLPIIIDHNCVVRESWFLATTHKCDEICLVKHLGFGHRTHKFMAKVCLEEINEML